MARNKKSNGAPPATAYRGWAHLAGTTNTPFRSGEHGQVAIKVIDDRGNEMLVVEDVKEAKS